MILKNSKFCGICYSDEKSELQFFGKEFKVRTEDKKLILSFKLMKGLDKEEVLENIKGLTFFEIQDQFIQHRLMKLLQESPQVTTIFLELNDYTFSVKRLKILMQGFLLRMV